MYDIGIIGSGPAGYVTAIKATLEGLKVILFEEKHFGGTCLNSGCIPTKATIFCSDLYSKITKAEKYGLFINEILVDYQKIKTRRDDIISKKNKALEQLLKSHSIEIVFGKAILKEEGVICADNQEFSCKNIIIATGSKAFIPEFFKDNNSNIHSSETLLDLNEIPQNITIIGSGAIGIEWSRIFSSLKKQVSLIELAPEILPLADFEVSQRLERILKKHRVKIYKNTVLDKIENNICHLNNGEKISSELILVAVGRQPNISFDELNLLNKNEKGFIEVDNNFITNMENIYAIGDVNGISQLAHSASKQGELVIEHILSNKETDFKKCIIPSIIYGTPEIAWIGKTEQELKEAGINYKASNLPVSTLAKAYTDDEIDGFMKVLTVENKIAGVHLITKEASSLLPVFQYMMENSIEYTKLTELTYAHPTYAEGISEMLLNLDNKAIHIMKAKV